MNTSTTQTLTLAIALAFAGSLGGCDTSDDPNELRSRDIEVACFEVVGTEQGFTIGNAPERFFTCCQDGECGPPVNGFCPGGGILHECEDELTCNDEACWHECHAVPPGPNS